MIVDRGSTALVTGASKGLGEAFADALAARGVNLVLVARSVGPLRALANRLTASYGVHCLVLNADLSDPDAADQIGAEVKRQGTQIDLLINNAGLGLTGDFLSHDIRQEQAAIQVNVQAVVALAHLFGRDMAIRGAGGIINTASTYGHRRGGQSFRSSFQRGPPTRTQPQRRSGDGCLPWTDGDQLL
jgi:short-subunit dehydrogenase